MEHRQFCDNYGGGTKPRNSLAIEGLRPTYKTINDCEATLAAVRVSQRHHNVEVDIVEAHSTAFKKKLKVLVIHEH